MVRKNPKYIDMGAYLTDAYNRRAELSLLLKEFRAAYCEHVELTRQPYDASAQLASIAHVYAHSLKPYTDDVLPGAESADKSGKRASQAGDLGGEDRRHEASRSAVLSWAGYS